MNNVITCALTIHQNRDIFRVVAMTAPNLSGILLSLLSRGSLGEVLQVDLVVIVPKTVPLVDSGGDVKSCGHRISAVRGSPAVRDIVAQWPAATQPFAAQKKVNKALRKPVVTQRGEEGQGLGGIQLGKIQKPLL